MAGEAIVGRQLQLVLVGCEAVAALVRRDLAPVCRAWVEAPWLLAWQEDALVRPVAATDDSETEHSTNERDAEPEDHDDPELQRASLGQLRFASPSGHRAKTR